METGHPSHHVINHFTSFWIDHLCQTLVVLEMLCFIIFLLLHIKKHYSDLIMCWSVLSLINLRQLDSDRNCIGCYWHVTTFSGETCTTGVTIKFYFHYIPLYLCFSIGYSYIKVHRMMIGQPQGCINAHWVECLWHYTCYKRVGSHVHYSEWG